MAARVAARPRCRRLSFRRASAPILVVLCLGAGLAAGGASAWAQDAQLGQQWVGIPRQVPRPPSPNTPNPQMLLQADEINYDYNNVRVVAVGHVQMYYKGSSVEAHRVVYDQKTKRLRAEGNVIIAQADGQIVHGEILDLNDDYRDGFVDSLRLEAPDRTRSRHRAPSAARAQPRSSRAEPTPPASHARMIPPSRPSGRSTRSASSTTKPNR